MAVTSWAHLAPRLARVRQRIAAADIDALLVSHLPNVRYLTGFDGSSADLVVTGDRLHFITDFRYVTVAESLLADASGLDATLVIVDRSYDETVRETLQRLGAARIGVEADHLKLRRYRWLHGPPTAASPETPTLDLVATERIVEGARLLKDDHEIALMRAAAARLSEVALEVVPRVTAGRSERDIAAEVDWIIRRSGLERPAFETIVASGPNGALPHARPSARVLARGDMVVLDFGGVYDGYCVDLTRTVCLGPPDAESARMHAAVAAAQAAAVAAVAVGVAAGDIDAAARDVLEGHGLAEAFGHGTGHGLGLEVHEEPRISRRRPGAPDGDPGGFPVEAGMVFTIEPGVYVPGRGGVRIEDDVLVTPAGCEVLTAVPQGLDGT